MWTTHSKRDVDYSYFLGPNYKQKMNNKTTSTVIANHVSYIDIMLMIKHYLPSVAPKEQLKSTPLVSTYANSLGALYMPRGGSREAKDLALKLIRER